jgi:hypothetical protein
VGGGWEPIHVCTDLGQDGGAGNCLDPWDRLQQLCRLLKRGEPKLDVGLNACDRLGEEIDVRQDVANQDQVVWLDVADKCLV